MFYGDSALTSINVSSFDTSKVTDMMHMFENSTSLTSLNLKNFDTSKVIGMDSIFAGNTKLTTITVSSKWKIGSGVTTTDMFKDCGTDHVTVA